MRRLVNLTKTAQSFLNLRNRDGNAAIEYGMIAALIAVIIAASLSGVATKLIAVFGDVVKAL